MGGYTIIIIIFGLLILFFLIILFFLNRLVLLQNRIKKTFSTTRMYLDEMSELMGVLCEYIKNNLEHEDNLIKKIMKVQMRIDKIVGIEEGIEAIKESSKLYQEVYQLNTIYPKLKKKKEFQEVMNKLQKNQDRIHYSMDEYNKGVMNYNQYRKQPFIYFLSKLFRFPSYSNYSQ